MIKKIPVSATKLPIANIIASLFSLFDDRKAIVKLADKVKKYSGSENVFLLNSGLSCLYAILMALKAESSKSEVVLPAYTAGSLIVAIKEAGLKPVLCEVSPEDFNLDSNFLEKIVSEKTLCVIAVHMFGTALGDIEKIKSRYKDIIIIEDACQSMGTKINNKIVGGFGQISFSSFNKGKNFSTFGGGIIQTNDAVLAKAIDQLVSKAEKQSLRTKLGIFGKLIILSIVVNPFVYGLLYSIIERFKENKPPQGIKMQQYSGLQAKLAYSLLETLEEVSAKRCENGMRIISALITEKQFILPVISKHSNPAFNRVPIVFRDLKKRQRVETALEKAGIETSRMYLKPLHHMFDLDYNWGNFPNAVYLAGHLLTLPCHLLLKTSDIDRMIKIIKNA